MSSPKSKTTKLFRLEKSPSSGVFKIPRRSSTTSATPYPDDVISQRSAESLPEEQLFENKRNNELSKDISATVRLKTRSNNKPMFHNQQPQITRSTPTVDLYRSRPNLSHQSRTTAFPFQRKNPDSEEETDSDDEEINKPVEHYNFLKLMSNFEVLEIIYLLYNLIRGLSSKMFIFVTSSRYVSLEKTGKIHLHSFIYGFATGMMVIFMKPLIYNSLSYVANMALHATLCLVILALISFSITHRKSSNNKTQTVYDQKPGAQQQKKFDAREFYSNRPIMDPIRSSQIPLVNPIHPTSSRRGSALDNNRSNSSPIQTLYRTTNKSADAFISAAGGKEYVSDEEVDEDEEEDEEDINDNDDDDTKSLFSVLTSAGPYNSKKNYKSFIEQTKRLRLIN